LRWKTDHYYRLRDLASSSIRGALKRNGGSKNGVRTFDKLPYTLRQLKEHLENQFEDWMTWDNHGMYEPNKRTWHIDHIIPHSSFLYDSLDHPDFQKCWALNNLRPLCSLKNIQKGNKIDEEDFS